MVTIFLRLFVFNSKIVTFAMNFNVVGMTVKVRVIPGNLNDDLAIGTLKSILRESGLHF